MKKSNIPFSDKLSCNPVLRSSYISNIFMSMGLYQTQTYILIDSPSISDNSNEALETLSNLHSILAKVFSSYLEMRIYRMPSLLTRSDPFFVDLFTNFIHTPPYPEHPIHDLMP